MRRRIEWRIFIVLLAGLGLAQLSRPARTNPPITSTGTIENIVRVPPDVHAILTQACADCHSNQTVWHWYSHLAPISWFIVGHLGLRGARRAHAASSRARCRVLTLDRLEKKGFLSSHLTQPTTERGGRARRCHRVTRMAIAALRESRHALSRLESQAPDIDSAVILDRCDPSEWAPGTLITARIEGSKGYDLIAAPEALVGSSRSPSPAFIWSSADEPDRRPPRSSSSRTSYSAGTA